MNNIKIILISVILVISITGAYAEKWKGEVNPTPTPRNTGGCDPAKTSTELAVNNVRALIHTGGDMWWDLQGKARYEVPNGGGVNALFAGSIWVGGYDANGQLKLAAQRFRQDGIDYWPGPLKADASIERDICRKYDKHFTITKKIVKEFREWWACKIDPLCDETVEFPGYQIPEIIINWPAHAKEDGYDNISLAPWWDVNGDGVYNPNDGDFPYYEFPNEGITNDAACKRPRGQKARLFGDNTLWWVYNDKGNIHTETKGTAIGMEFRAQSFAFTTNDELNDMTFCNYNIINRSTYTLRDTYFGVWTDADLGFAKDDYVGCDVLRGLGYCYNGDDNDETADGQKGYGKQPPAVGIDFFEGPYQDPDGIDNSTSYDTVNNVKVLRCTKGDILNGNINGLNFQDGTVDNERWGMRRFLYFNNSGTGNPSTQDPHTAQDHYNYLTGYWLDNSPLCYGGTGHKSGGGDISTPTNFMFPGKPTTDPCGWGQNGIPKPDWSEETENNPPYDRRFVQSAGPFTLTPGAVNDITIGVVYARAASGGPWASVEAVRRADDKAQILFENCFRVLDGPDAPELKIIELDKKFIFQIYNKPSSNNYLEAYIERDPSIVCNSDINPCDIYYRFQGYQVFQYKDGSVSISDRYNGALVKELFQCDLKDNIAQVVNYKWSDELKANVPIEEVSGNNKGIIHTFVVEHDKFAGGDSRLVNNKEYYYTVIAYGYNNSMLYNQSVQSTFNGQKKPYLSGRNNIKRYKAIPRLIYPGTIANAEYGDGVEITQLEGYGNGNNVLDLSDETINEIMSGYPWKAKERKYKKGLGPIEVKIIDPLNIPDDSYELRFVDVAEVNEFGFIGVKDYALDINRFKPFNYVVVNSKGDTVKSEVSVKVSTKNEQIFSDWGFSVSIAQENYAGNSLNPYQNGYLTSSIEFQDETKPWLTFIYDTDTDDPFNWIRVGTRENQGIGACVDRGYDDMAGDKEQYFEKILNGSFAPYYYAHSRGHLAGTNGKYSVALEGARSTIALSRSEPLSSVNLVITSDTSKWTRCCVVEMHENEWGKDEACGFPKEDKPYKNLLSIGNAHKFALRQSPSVDKNGNAVAGDTTHGMGWFPGYAIDVVTGERLNIVFGEDSWLKEDNGADMKWNPTSKYYSSLGPIFGGKHYVYIMGNTRNKDKNMNAPGYDSCRFIYKNLLAYERTGIQISSLNRAWVGAMWVCIPMLNNNFDFLSTDVTIKLRTALPYLKGVKEFAIDNPKNDNLPYFKFSTSGVKTVYDDQQHKKNALDLIRVVPNPYYGNSEYEHGQLDNYVRITNLPKKCVISIYSVNGSLIRQYNKDNDNSFVEWDLKNSYNISIASGVYILHVNVPGVGEKVVKWFGALRPVDLNNF